MSAAPEAEEPRLATTRGRIIAVVALVLFAVFAAAMITVAVQQSGQTRTAQQATVTSLVESRNGTLFTCDVMVDREDGVREEIRIESSCNDAPQPGEQVKVWVSDDPDAFSYPDGHQDEESTDNVIGLVLGLGIPLLVVALPAAFYLRRPKAA